VNLPKFQLGKVIKKFSQLNWPLKKQKQKIGLQMMAEQTRSQLLTQKSLWRIVFEFGQILWVAGSNLVDKKVGIWFHAY
jgi:ribosomal protein S25